MKISFIQTALFWEECESNIRMFDAHINDIKETTDIVILPEMFSTGFSMKPELFADGMNGKAIKWMVEKASKGNFAICGSLMIKEADTFVNRFVWVDPEGNVSHYDKRHLFRMGEEQHHYKSGIQRLVINYKGWRIAPFICYDLRFPVWMKRTPDFNYDLIIIVANWPEKRSYHWKILNKARAIENQCYLAALNRVGIDNNGMAHSGDSVLVNPLGECTELTPYVEQVITVEIQKEIVDSYRGNFPVEMDDDVFEMK